MVLPLPPPSGTLYTVTVVAHVARAIVQAGCYSGRDPARLAEKTLASLGYSAHQRTNPIVRRCVLACERVLREERDSRARGKVASRR